MTINLQAERLRRGLSQQRFAEAAGVSEYVIFSAERGRRPHPENALKIAEFLGVDVIDLFPPAAPQRAASA